MKDLADKYELKLAFDYDIKSDGFIIDLHNFMQNESPGVYFISLIVREANKSGATTIYALVNFLLDVIHRSANLKDKIYGEDGITVDMVKTMLQFVQNMREGSQFFSASKIIDLRKKPVQEPGDMDIDNSAPVQEVVDSNNKEEPKLILTSLLRLLAITTGYSFQALHEFANQYKVTSLSDGLHKLMKSDYASEYQTIIDTISDTMVKHFSRAPEFHAFHDAALGNRELTQKAVDYCKKKMYGYIYQFMLDGDLNDPELLKLRDSMETVHAVTVG